MKDRAWYLGPLGNVRPLPTPDTDMDFTVTAYGGVHQGLSGARTKDITGHKSEISLSWSYLRQSEYEWLQAMHEGYFTGPFHLFNPLKKNRLSRESSASRAVRRNAAGLRIPTGNVNRVRRVPDDISLGGMSLMWDSWGSDRTVSFDTDRSLPVLDEETVTFSVYLLGSGEFTVDAWLSYSDADGGPEGESDRQSFTMSTDFQRVSVTATVGASVVAARPHIEPQTGSGTLAICAPQLESENEASSWELGGAASTVVIDELTSTSPRYPLYGAEITLLEA